MGFSFGENPISVIPEGVLVILALFRLGFSISAIMPIGLSSVLNVFENSFNIRMVVEVIFMKSPGIR